MGHFSIGFHSPHQCLPGLAQTVNIDDCSLANYVWLIFTKCITDSLDRSPCEPSSRKFFRRQTSNMKGTHAFCSAENSDGSAFRPQFPGSLGPYSAKIKRGQWKAPQDRDTYMCKPFSITYDLLNLSELWFRLLLD